MIPYEFIGRVTVVVLTIALVLLIYWIGIALMKALTHRIITEIINLCWRGYDFKGEHPPRWRREIALHLHCARDGDWDKLQEKRKNLKKYEETDE